MQFQDELAAGIVLIRPALRSPDFVSGATGWSINQDGSAEFNDITIRAGTVISGTSLYYTPSPGAGNLFMSLADAAGTDEFGNTYPKGLSVGSDTTRQIVLDFAANVAFMQFSVNNGNAANSGTLLEAIVNEGDADEYLSMQAHSPAVVGFTDRIQLQLNSQNLDGSSEANAVFQHSTAGNLLTLDPDVITAGTILRVVRGAAGNNALSVRVTGDTNSRLLINADGSLSWGAGGGSAVDTTLSRAGADQLSLTGQFTTYGSWTTFTPTWNNLGTGTFSTNVGWYKRLGDAYLFEIYAVASAAGSGTTALTISNLPFNPFRAGNGAASTRERAGAHCGGVAAGTNSSVSGSFTALVLAGGAASTIDRLTGPTGIDMRGENLGASTVITIKGWMRAV